ncbi:MAG: hypothetical protein LQ344_005147 [Seirophora lacunosa]|nr:MAG: hypothetical protein LQ344_005147 [Seirophora lacunosa]
MSYYDIDAILTDAQKIPCTFSLPVPSLGFLDENPGGDIPADVPIPLPLYLATLLAIQRLAPGAPPLVAIDLPASLAPRVLNALKADARTVDLRGLEVGFYEGASRVLELLEDTEDEVGTVVEGAFKVRAAAVADFARGVVRGGVGGEGEAFLRGLEEWERESDSRGFRNAVFRAAHDSSKAVRVWMGEVKNKKKK